MSKEKIILIGKKIGMTQVYDDQGALVPVTVVEAGPCPITQVRTTQKDGYQAVQIGFSNQKQHRMSKAEVQHLSKSDIQPLAHLIEFRTTHDHQVGDIFNVACFNEGDLVDVIGKTKGRGFQGVVKRWNFGGGPASHGSMFHRRGGGFGQRQEPGEIMKNRKMPGHMGVKNRTVQNLRIVRILTEKNLLLIQGSFPGGKGSLVYVRHAKKASF